MIRPVTYEECREYMLNKPLEYEAWKGFTDPVDGKSYIVCSLRYGSEYNSHKMTWTIPRDFVETDAANKTFVEKVQKMFDIIQAGI